MAHQYMPKTFHDPHKNPPAPPPTYLRGNLRRIQNPVKHMRLSELVTGFRGELRILSNI